MSPDVDTPRSERVAVRLTKATKQQLEEEARGERRTLSQWIELAVRAELERRGKLN